MISTKVHGYLDYMMGVLLILLPFILEIPDGAATTLLIVLGVSALVYSALTNYELGMVRVIPMKVHLIIDCAAGALLIAAPWLFGFSEQMYWPFIILGVLELGASLLTEKTSKHPVPQS